MEYLHFLEGESLLDLLFPYGLIGAAIFVVGSCLLARLISRIRIGSGSRRSKS